MARKQLEDLLSEAPGNKLVNGTLYVASVEDPVIYSISNELIERIVVSVPRVYIILDGADKSKNNVQSIELTTPGATLSLKNARPDCMIAIKEMATIAYLTTNNGASTIDSIILGEEKIETE